MDKKLVGGLLDSLNVPSLMFCANKCTSSQYCQTFNFKPHDLSATASEQINCQLLSMTKESSGATLTASTGWIHYEPAVQESPRCRSVQCPAGFKCVESCKKKSGYECLEQWISGNGIGGTETYIGVYSSKEACILECSKRSKDGVYANGATYTNSSCSCYCEFGMTGRSGAELTSSYIFPSCTFYILLTEAHRNVDAHLDNRCGDSGLTFGSYRISGSAGVKVPTSCVAGGSCSSDGPGWIAAPEPTQADGVVARKVCFSDDKDCCVHSNMVRVRNCSSYLVYELVSTGSKYRRYCGAF
eukprot:gene14987-16533_t